MSQERTEVLKEFRSYARPEVLAALRQRGHEIEVLPAWDTGKALGITLDRDRGVIHGGASPRRGSGYACGW